MQHPFDRPPPSRNPISGGSWGGRVSDHRRAQVRARVPEPQQEGPTGPVESARRQSAAQPARVVGTDPWSAAFAGLQRDLRTLSTALLCTADGQPVASVGVVEPDVPTLAWQTAAAWAAAGILDASRRGADQEGVETIQLAAGLSQTVIARVGTAGQGHLLAVSAEGTTPAALLLKARQAAYELRESLAAADSGC